MHKARGLEYEAYGDGEPVLTVHGSHVAGSFLPLVREPALAGGYRLIRYHRRGFAGSDRAGGGFGIEDQARDALTLLEHLGVPRAHVVGHSYGGVVALQLALDAPRAVRSLVLLEPPLLTPELAAGLSTQLEPAVRAYRAGDAGAAVDAFMREACGPGWRAEAEAAVPGGAEQAERDAATFFEVEAPALERWAFDAERASRLPQPVLYVVGGESAPVFEAGRGLFLAAAPRTESVTLPGLNHLLHVRDPARVAASIADFLARHPL
jgi:pimeloyl-ACP methyl ester carboxylesterase